MPLAALHLQLAPILAAEKSKTAFYIVGGVLVLWAFGLSLGIGTRRPDFPSSLKGQRVVMAVTTVLVAATIAAAVLTSGPPGTHAKITKAQHIVLAGAEIPSKPAVSTTPTATSGASASATTSTPPAEAPPSVSEGGHKLTVAANPEGQLAYNTKSLSAKAGKVTITMTNMAPLEHNITIAQGTKVLGATPTFTGGSRTLALTLKPGKYVFYCSVTGHRQAGMEGTLTVSP
jgi:plastocyanin